MRWYWKRWRGDENQIRRISTETQDLQTGQAQRQLATVLSSSVVYYNLCQTNARFLRGNLGDVAIPSEGMGSTRDMFPM